MMLGVGVIGLGEVGAVHAAAVAGSADARLVAVCDRDAGLLEKGRQTFACRGFADAMDLFADPAVDVVSICLPHHLHFPIAMQALQAGKHVLLEKPMAPTIEDCDRLIAEAEVHGVTLGVSHNRIFVPSIQRARELVASGEIGRPVLIRHRFGIHEPYTGWRADPGKSGGGLLSDAGVHGFYVAEHIFGPIRSVRALLDAPPAEGEQFAVVWLEFESGARGIIEGSYFGPKGMFDDSIEVIGTNAVLKLAGLEAAAFGYRVEPVLERYQDRAWRTEDIHRPGWEETITSSVRAFLAALAAGRPVPTSGRAGRESIRLLTEAYADPLIVGRAAVSLN